MTVCKELTFDAAHMLSNYKGKCNNLHGHTYRVRVQLTGDVQPDGMLVDFNKIKNIIDVMDHAIILGGEQVQDEAEKALYAWADKFNKRIFVMPADMKPTAENMSVVLTRKLHDLPGVKSVVVDVWETPTAYASSFSDNQAENVGNAFFALTGKVDEQ